MARLMASPGAQVSANHTLNGPSGAPVSSCSLPSHTVMVVPRHQQCDPMCLQ